MIPYNNIYEGLQPGATLIAAGTSSDFLPAARFSPRLHDLG